MKLDQKIYRGAIWSSLEKLSAQVLSFILGIILTRLLTPKEYGIIGLTIVFITFSQVFIDSGFSKALIQKQDRSNKDISTVFIFNIIVGLLCFTILWLLAPYISDFYQLQELKSLLRVIAVSLIFNALFSIPLTLFTIALDFKTIAKVNIITIFISSSIAIYLAYLGYGAWALVWQTVIRSILSSVLIWWWVKWHPILIFSYHSFKNLFSFGSKLLISSLLGNLSGNINALLIGKYIGPSQLGFYTRGAQFSDILFGIFSSSISSVLLPSLSTIQNKTTLLIAYTRTILKSYTLILVPVFFCTAALAKPIITVLLTEKWIEAVPILQIFCIGRFLAIITSVSINLLHVIGRTDLELRQQYINIPIRLVFLILALQHGIIYIAFAEVLATVVHLYVNAYFPGKIMNYGALKQLKDIFPMIVAGIFMVIFILFVQIYFTNDILKICIIPIMAGTFYLAILYLINKKELLELMKGFRKI